MPFPVDSTQIRLASVDEVMQAKAYLCFVSPICRPSFS
jgi:hypothetical protein